MGRIVGLNKTNISVMNLPQIPSDGKHGELYFCNSFLRTFVKREKESSIFIKEFAIQGCGVADFLLVKFNHRTQVKSLSAFEVKLTDWKQGLAQAFRYSYFADNTFLILPEKKCSSALANLNVFEQLNIGLYGFNEENKKIKLHYAPASSKALNRLLREKAEKTVYTRV